jgi:hypothetical protein
MRVLRRRNMQHSWEDKIRVSAGVDLIHLVQNRVMSRDLLNTAKNVGIPYKAWNFLTH